MDVQDAVFTRLYLAFVAEGGLDQTERIVNEDFERVERQAAYCLHGGVKRSCPFCGARPLPPGMGGYTPN